MVRVRLRSEWTQVPAPAWPQLDSLTSSQSLPFFPQFHLSVPNSITCSRNMFSSRAMVSLAIKCQEQHHLLGWCKDWRDQVRKAPRFFSYASQVSGRRLPSLTWALGLPRRVGGEKGVGVGSVLKAILLGHGASGLWGISLWKSPTGHSPHLGGVGGAAEILDSQDRHKSLLGAVCCF